MTTPHTPPAALPDVAAAPDARDNLRRVRAMYDAAPPEGCDDGDRTPALERVVASLAGGYSTSDLDARDVRCLVVAFDDAEQIIDALQGQAALLRGEVNELRAKVADLTGDYETGCDETRRLGDELRTLAAQHAGDVAAAVAGERARARRCTIYSERFDGCSMIDALQAARGMIENGEDDEVCEYCHDTGVNAASSKPCRCCEWARVLAADALAAPTGGGE